MAFHGGITRDKLEKARERNFDGYRRLANFVGAASYTTGDVFIACERQRANQNLVKVRDRRTK